MACSIAKRCTDVAVLILGLGAAAAASCAQVTLPDGCSVAGQVLEQAALPTPPAASFPPVQLEMRTPVAPAALASGGLHYLFYEVHLRNFAHEAMAVHSLDVLAGSAQDGRLLASFSGPALAARLVPVGQEGFDGKLDAGRSAVAFLCLAFEQGVAVPAVLQHRIRVQDARAIGPAIPVSRAALPVIAAPIAGTGWTAGNGPSLDSHHRMGLIVTEGRAQISRRYALDWKKWKNGEQFAGDAREVRSYHAYGESVFAVADGVVVDARDGFPDNIPRTAAGFTPAVPLTMASIAGNTIVIELGKGQFASYSHLQPGSVKVKTGQRVRKGQVLGRIGNSGDARWPHLHFQMTTTPDILDSESLPFVLEEYSTMQAGARRTVRKEYPLGDVVIDIAAP